MNWENIIYAWPILFGLAGLFGQWLGRYLDRKEQRGNKK